MSTALHRSPPEFRRGKRERKEKKGPKSRPPSSSKAGGRRCVLSLDDKKRKARSRTITPRGSDLGLHKADGEGGRGMERGIALRFPPQSRRINLAEKLGSGRAQRAEEEGLLFWPRLALFLLPPSLAFVGFVSQYFSPPSLPSAPVGGSDLHATDFLQFPSELRGQRDARTSGCLEDRSTHFSCRSVRQNAKSVL